MRKLNITEYELPKTKSLRRCSGPLRIAVLADVHDSPLAVPGGPLTDMIDYCRPDLILGAGDMVIARPGAPKFDTAIALLDYLSERYPVFLVNGNHETRMRDHYYYYGEDSRRYFDRLGEMNLVQLNNRQTVLRIKGADLLLAGYEAPLECYIREHPARVTTDQITRVLGRPGQNADMRVIHDGSVLSAAGAASGGGTAAGAEQYASNGGDAAGTAEDHASGISIFAGAAEEHASGGGSGAAGAEDTYTILLAHHPSHFAAYAQWGADLVLSGHLHGGMIRLPFLGGVIGPSYIPFPKYDLGRFTMQIGSSSAGKADRRRTAEQTDSGSAGKADRRHTAEQTDSGSARKADRRHTAEQTDSGSAEEAGRRHTAEMIVSAGIGDHTLPLRFNNPPELIMLTFR